jgi:hypothetical protein
VIDVVGQPGADLALDAQAQFSHKELAAVVAVAVLQEAGQVVLEGGCLGVQVLKAADRVETGLLTQAGVKRPAGEVDRLGLREQSRRAGRQYGQLPSHASLRSLGQRDTLDYHQCNIYH